MPFNKLVLFVVLLVFSQLSLSAACPASSDTTTAGNGDCTITGGASTIQLNFTSGFDSSTTVTAVDGNNGTTLGAQRKLSFIKAAEIISEQVTSTVTIIVEANFSALSCTTNSAVLGSAGATANLSISSSPPAGIIANTNYPIGLYNAITGSDVSGAHDDIDANFNSDIGDADCLASSSWYYGFSDASGTEIGFTTVLLHEMTHGLGFASLVDPSDGSQSGGIDDIFSANLYDNVTGRSWNDNSQTDQNREDSAISVDDLLWSGTNVNTNAIGLLTNGFNDVDTDGNFESGDQIEMYAPASVESGSSVSHFTTDATPNELMEPSYTDSLYSLGLSLYLLEDIGWTIVEPNNAPTITAVDQTTSEDNAIVVDISGWGNDADSDSLTYSVTSCATNITCSLTGTNLTLTPDSNHNGATHTITVKVDDGTDNNSDSFNLNVTAQNDAPTWSTISEQNTNEDNDLVIDLSTYSNDVDGDTLTYSVSSCATNITCSVSGDNLTLSPTANYSGATHNITVEVDDSTASAVSTSFNLVVNAQNDAPTWSAIPDQSIDDGDNVVINLNTYASDIDGDSLDYTATSCGANLTCSISSNTLTVSASGGSGSTVSVTIEADDNNGGTNSDTFDVTITTPANNAPTITAVDQTTTEDNAIVVDISAWGSDADGDGLTYSVTSCASNITCSLSGTSLTLTPDTGHSGATHNITIEVDDTNGGTASDSFNLEVTAENDAPTITATDQTTSEDTTLVVDISTWGSDADNDSLSYSLSSCADNITCTLTGTSLSLTPSANHHGSSHSMTIQVSDPDGANASGTFNLNVVSINDTPIFSDMDDINLIEGDSYSLDLLDFATDIDGDALSFSLLSCPTALVCNLINSSLSLQANSGAGSSVQVSVQALDANGASVSKIVNVNIRAFSASTYIEVGGTRYDHNDTLSIPASDINISVLGGSGDYEYQLNYLDGDVNNLIESDASDLTLQMPDTGSFAGQYTLSITDTSNSETIVVTLIRPIRLVWSASDLLSGDNSQEIVIEGGEVGSQYSLAQLQDTLLTFKDTDGTVQTQFTASDDQDSFNGAKVKIEVGIVTILTDLEVTVSTLNNTYEDDTTELQVYPAIEHHIQVMDTNTTPIPQASAELSATTLLTQLNLPVDYSADENGEMIIRLPDTQAVNQLTIQSNQFNPATLMLDESLTEHQVILTALSQFITLTGSISALGTQNFVSHPPQVLLDFEDGSIDSVTVSVSNSSQASFSHDVDINSRSLTNMRVIQADSLNIELDISSLSQNQTYNILLERSIAVVVSTPSSDSGGGPLNLLILLGLMFTLIPRKQSWQA